MSLVSILLPDLRGGGAERVSVDLALEVARLGHDAEFVLLSARGELLREVRAFCSVVDLNCLQVRRVPILLARYLHARRPDVLLVGMWPLTAVAPPIAKLVNPGGRVVVCEHAVVSIGPSLKGLVSKFALHVSASVGYRFADQRVAVSEGVALDMSAFSHLNRRHMRVIHNPVRPTQPCRVASKAVGSSAGNAFKIVAIGNLSQVKNYDLLVRALFIARREVDFSAHILGEGPERSALEKLIDQLGLSEKVHLEGFQRDVGAWYEAADIFVHTSRAEGFGNVIIEALSYGVPVVCTDCPVGPREILMDGKFGSLVPMDDAPALAAEIVKCVRAPRDASSLKARANDFSMSRFAAQYTDVLAIDDSNEKS